MSILLSAENIFYEIRKPEKQFEIFPFQRPVGSGKDSRKELLKNISFSIEEGEIAGIAGESGAGKTTLARIIAGIIKPSSGSVKLNLSGKPKQSGANPIQILFQNNGEILNPFRQIDEIVEEALIISSKERIKHTDIERMAGKKEKIFKAVNFPASLQKRKGFELSGGEQQRAALARILAAEPLLLILDEPFSSQDPESQINFLNLFKNINKEFGTAMLCISHNLKILRQLCGRIIIMYNGEIVESGPAAEVLNTPQHPYTRYLLKAEEYDLSCGELKQNFSERRKP